MASVPSGMGTDMNPYLAYRPSGVEWLGDVPQHWGVLAALKDVGSPQNDGGVLGSRGLAGGGGGA